MTSANLDFLVVSVKGEKTVDPVPQHFPSTDSCGM